MKPKASLFFVLGLAALSAAVLLTGAVLPQGPNLTVFFTGDQNGEVASCGCPKEDYGGSTRKAAFFDTLRTSGWSFLTVDLGDFVPFDSLTAQGRMKAETMARAMATMKYDAVTFGDRELAEGPDYAAQLADWLGQPILATNYSLPDGRSVPTKLVDVRGKKVGLVAFLDPKLVPDTDWIHIEPWKNERSEVEKLRKKADVLVALVHAPDTTRVTEFADLYPDVDLVLGAHEGYQAGFRTQRGHTFVVGSAGRGRYLGRVEVIFNAEGKVDTMESAYLPVVEQWGRRAAVDSLLFAYYRDVRKLVETTTFQKQTQAALKEPAVEYVGTETCTSCHAGPAAQWATTAHAHAHKTLADEDKDHDPECQQCHTVGFGYRTGFATPELTPDRWNVGCENCHGPGAAHVAAPEEPYGAVTEQTCRQCHNTDRSPDFDYATYRPKIVHTNEAGDSGTGSGGH